jgi:Arc/MetJ-type ribon-helix-helix transcriptional regulator
LRNYDWRYRWYHISMNKTTVYLPDELKQSVARMAAASGRSEAEVIREAIAALARASDRPRRPRGGLFASGDPSLSAQAQEALAGFGER